jgi:uncharacterized protein YcbK (DUF882 family)
MPVAVPGKFRPRRENRLLRIFAALNSRVIAAVGGAPHSQHVLGKAADIRVSGMTARELYAAATSVPQFHGFRVDDERGFLHVDIREKPVRWCYRAGRAILWDDGTAVLDYPIRRL